MAEKCISSKTVTVRPQDLTWMNNNLRKLMRKRNRLFKKYIKRIYLSKPITNLKR